MKKPILLIVAMGGNINKLAGHYNNRWVTPPAKLCHYALAFAGGALSHFGHFVADNFSGVVEEVVALKESDDLTKEDAEALRMCLLAAMSRYQPGDVRVLVTIGGNRLFNVVQYFQDGGQDGWRSDAPLTAQDLVRLDVLSSEDAMVARGSNYAHPVHYHPVRVCFVSTNGELFDVAPGDTGPQHVQPIRTLHAALRCLLDDGPDTLMCVLEKEKVAV